MKSAFLFESVTYAIKARKHLERQGIRSKLVKRDGVLPDYGCSWMLEIDTGDYYSAITHLRDKGLKFKAVNLYDLP